mmetsp:Transcript_4166/g.12478  ORF Transcript_4166/g.12478 Transcript_4166/m.12478 type:complete len:444 (+) Transcript_4166:1472-2803(+)
MPISELIESQPSASAYRTHKLIATTPRSRSSAAMIEPPAFAPPASGLARPAGFGAPPPPPPPPAAAASISARRVMAGEGACERSAKEEGGALPRDRAVGREPHDVAGRVGVVRVVGGEEDGAAPGGEEAAHALAHQLRTDLGVDGGEHVVEEDGGGRAAAGRVAGAREGDARLLAAGEVDAPLSDLGPVPGGQLLEVGGEGARAEHLLVEARVEGLAEEHVVLERHVLYPRLLGTVHHLAAQHGAPLEPRHVAEQREQHRRLAATHRAEHDGERAAAEREVEGAQRRRASRLLRPRPLLGEGRAHALGGVVGAVAEQAAPLAPLLLLPLVRLHRRLGPAERGAVQLDCGRAGSGGQAGEEVPLERDWRVAADDAVAVAAAVELDGLAALRVEEAREAPVDDGQVDHARDHHRHHEEGESDDLEERERGEGGGGGELVAERGVD